MTLSELLFALAGAGVRLRAVGSGIGCTPAQVVSPALAAEIICQKPPLLSLLSPSSLAPTDPDAADLFLERMGIADELDMPTDTGSCAWMIAVAESIVGPAPCTFGHDSRPSPRPGAHSISAPRASYRVAEICAPGERFPGEPTWPRTKTRK